MFCVPGSSMLQERPFYQLFLPQTDASQTETQLVCRKKRKVPKYRFRYSPELTVITRSRSSPCGGVFFGADSVVVMLLLLVSTRRA